MVKLIIVSRPKKKKVNNSGGNTFPLLQEG